jgi:peptidoglycan/LPS O-acetylase OafA/YrhL
MRLMPDHPLDVGLKATARHVIRDIEVLRALAVLFTVFHHRAILLAETRSHVLDPYFEWWGGVDIFFVVSGFVISRGLLASRERCRSQSEFLVEVLAFWIRRIWRIWPTAWLWLVIVLFMSIVTASGVWGGFLGNLRSIVPILSNVQNIYMHYDVNGAGPHSAVPFGVYWSLSVEEQFYLLLPIALLYFRYRRLALLCVVLAAVQIVWDRPLWGVLWAVRSDALLLGVLIGLSFDHPRLRAMLEPVFLRRPAWLRYVSTGLLLFMIAGMAALHVVPFFTGVIALLAALLVWFASFDADYILPESYLKQALVWLGSRSYAIYLIHIPAFLFTLEIWHHVMPPGTVIGGRFTLRLILTWIPVVLGLAEINYRVVEQPLRRKGHRIARQFIVRHRLGPVESAGRSHPPFTSEDPGAHEARPDPRVSLLL